MSETPPTKSSRKRRWPWGAAIVLLAILFHVPLLRGIGGFFIVDEAAGQDDAVLIISGDHRLQVAADLLSSGKAHRVWIIPGRPNYLEASGVLPARTMVLQDELASLGTGSQQIDILDGEPLDLTDTARVLKARLEESPDVRIVALCAALHGRHVRLVLDDVLGDALASRVSIKALPYDQFDAGQWWRSRSGLKAVFNEICAIGFTMIMGTGPQPEPEPVEPDEWEDDLRQQFGAKACHEF